MMYYTFAANNKDYKLRLNTRNIVALEKKLGCNPIMIFGDGDRIPSVTEMVAILGCSLEQYNHGLSLNDAYDIFDAYLADGHSTSDFIKVIIKVYKVSGIIPDDNDDSEEVEKN